MQFFSKTDAYPIDIALHEDNEEFIEWLQLLSMDRHANKDDNVLTSPSFFKTLEGVDTKRGIDNILFLRNIYLDIDRDYSLMILQTYSGTYGLLH
jgi:hypothetical protein